MTKQLDAEDRRQQQLRRLGTDKPICRICGQTHPATFERHHIAGRKHDDDEVLVCANCHRILSDKQRDHAPHGEKKPSGHTGSIGHYLLGLADLLEMIVDALRRFGAWLLNGTKLVATP